MTSTPDCRRYPEPLGVSERIPLLPVRERSSAGTVAAILLPGCAFLGVQALLSLDNSRSMRFAATLGFFGGKLPESFTHHLLVALVVAGIVYTSLVIAQAEILAQGYRLAWSVPITCLILLPLILPLGALHSPSPLGGQWIADCFARCEKSWFRDPWIGGIADLILVLMPGAWMATRGSAGRRWPGTLDISAIVGILLASALSAIVYLTASVMGPAPALGPYVATVIFGLICGFGWKSIGASCLFGAVAGGFVPLAIAQVGVATFSRTVTGYPLREYWVFALAGVVACAWEPLATAMRWLVRRPHRLVIAVNALNLIDAILTQIAVQTGKAVETNPFVVAGGIPLKILLVGAISLVLLRYRPAALVWPTSALAWVVCYHLSGIVVNHGI